MNDEQGKIRIKRGKVFSQLTFQGKIFFVLQIFGVFFIIFLFLYFTNLLPGLQTSGNNVVESQFLSYIPPDQLISEFPENQSIPDKIRIPKIDVDTIIENPPSRDVATLDGALQRGAVYYPGSGTIEQGNIFIFGHSTNWPVVRNQAYKTFNNLEDLQKGDQIEVISDGISYFYIVDSVKLIDANDAIVDFSQKDRKLTLSTCNTFGQKQDRYVVEAFAR